MGVSVLVNRQKSKMYRKIFRENSAIAIRAFVKDNTISFKIRNRPVAKKLFVMYTNTVHSFETAFTSPRARDLNEVQLQKDQEST